MCIAVNVSLVDFEFWGGARRNAAQLTQQELTFLDEWLTDYFEGDLPTETTINDLFWFEFERICEILGLIMDDDGDIIRTN